MIIPNVGKKLKTNVDIANQTIKKEGKLSGLVEAFEGADGRIKYRSTFDGYVADNIIQVEGHINATGITAFNTFTSQKSITTKDGKQVVGGADVLRGRKGLSQIADEVELLNTALSGLTAEQKAIFGDLGIKNLIGQQVQMTRAQFEYGGDMKTLNKIVSSDFAKNAGIINITDEGVTVINYSVNGQLLSSRQASLMRNALGVGNLTEELTKDLVSGKFKGLAKLPKRMQSLLAERDVALTGDSIKNLLDEKGGAFIYDDVSAFFRGMLDSTSLTEEERFLMSHGLGLSEGKIRRITLSKSSSGLKELRSGLRDQFKQISHIEDDAQLMQMQRYMQQAKNEFASLTSDAQAELGNDYFNLFKKKIKNLSESAQASESEKKLALAIETSFDGVERMRDGTFVGNVNLIDDFMKDVQGQINSIKNRAGLLTEGDVEQLNALKSQLEALKHMKDAGQEGLDSAIARLAFPGGQGKGEIFLRKFGFIPNSLRDKMLFLPQSAVKKEIQSEIPSIVLNVAKSHKEQVYSDPLMLLYHQDYFGQENFTEGIQKNIDRQIQAVEDFLKTGQLDDKVRDEVLGAVSSQLQDDIPFEKLASGSRAAYLRNRAEARSIQEMLQAGVDPRQIPALVRRINDYYATQAFRMKGERVDLAMPGAMRRSIKTYESVLATGEGSRFFETTAVDLSKIGGGVGTADLNFLQFRLQGNNMLINGPAAHLYHHSLGTFDLDDKGVPLMTTFKGADGSDRFAFMTLRQPTGLQERIFMQADLAHTETLKQTLSNFGGDFNTLLNDADATSNLNNEEMRIVSLMRKALNGEKQIDFTNITSDDINKLMTKLANSNEAINKHGFARLVAVSNESLLEMAQSGSASPLGLDKKIQIRGLGTTSQQQYRELLLEAKIKPETMPDYTVGNYLRILTTEDANVKDKILVDQFNSISGQRFSSMNQIKNYLDLEGKNKNINAHQRAIRTAQFNTAAEEFVKNLQTGADISVENSLGLYINRQGVAASMGAQINDVIKQLGFDDIESFYKVQFSAGVIPPSEAVDVSKSLIAKPMIQAEQMKALAVAMDVYQSQGEQISEKAALNLLDRMGTGQLQLGAAGIEALEQTGRGVGFLRALQIAQQTAEEDLIGFDRALFGDGTYARIRSGEDISRTVSSVVQGAERAQAYLRKQNATQEEIDRIQSFIEQMQKLEDSNAIERLSLRAGTEAYEKYALNSKFSIQAERSRNIFEGLQSRSRKLAKLGYDPYQATIKAEHIGAVDQLIESQRDNLERLQSVLRLSEENMGDKLERALLETKTNTFFYETLSAMQEKNNQTNILDLVDTLEARISDQFNTRTADVALSARTGIVDSEDAMVQLIKDARSRRIQSKVLRASNIESYDIMTSTAQDRGYKALEEITPQMAREMIEDQQRLAALTGGGIGNEADSFYDFMRLVSGDVKLEMESVSRSKEVSLEAQEAFRRTRALQEMDRLDSVYNGNNTSNNLLRGADISDDARNLVDNIAAADDITSVQRGSFTRIQDFVKSGAMRELFQDKLIRNSTYALAGLAAFGFIYSARKERTEDEISGPALMPGGSAYESDMPKSFPSISDLKYLNPVVRGMQYKINVMGSQQDIDKMQYLAGNVVGGPVDSTMYSSLPRLGRDPYSEIASRY